MKSNTTVLIILTLVVAAGAYWYFFTGSDNSPALSAQTNDSQAQLEFQVLVGELQPISFDTGIFSDPRFLSLIDLATPVAPETLGRTDPFAPVPGVK